MFGMVIEKLSISKSETENFHLVRRLIIHVAHEIVVQEVIGSVKLIPTVGKGDLVKVYLISGEPIQVR